MTKQKKIESLDPADAVVCVLNEANEALNDKKHASTINRMEAPFEGGLAVGAIVVFVSALVYTILNLEASQETELWKFVVAICAGICFMVLVKVNKFKMMEGEKIRLLKIAVKKIHTLEKALKDEAGAVEERTNLLCGLKTVLQHKVEELQANLGISVKCDLDTNTGFDVATYTLSYVSNALKHKTFTEKETRNTLISRMIRGMESFFVESFQLMLVFAGIAVIYILIVMACLHFTSLLGLVDNTWVMILSVLVCLTAAFAVTVIVVLPKVNKPKMSVQEKTRILETAVENNRAIEKALEDETNATKERTDYPRSLNILLQQKIIKLRAQLQEYSNSTRETQMNKTFLSQKILIVTIAAAAVIASCTRSPNVGPKPDVGPTPDTKWYTDNPEADTFYIATADELAGLAQIINDVNNKIYLYDNNIDTLLVDTTSKINFYDKIIILTNDIDLSSYGKGSTFNNGKGWIPIGTIDSSCGYCAFRGVFDGNNKKISGLYINDSTLDYVGLFGKGTGYNRWQRRSMYGDDGVIKNLGLVDVDITGKNYVGGVAGYVSDGSMINCYSTGTVSGNDNVGGVAGYVSDGNMTNCYSTGTVSGNDNVGGVVGAASNSSSNYSYHRFECRWFHYSYIGSEISCSSTATVKGRNNVGGVVGTVSGKNWEGDCCFYIVNNSYSTGEVRGGIGENVGGVVGKIFQSKVIDSYFTGTVDGWNNVGGVVGLVESYRSAIINSYNTGAVRGNDYVGGVAGSTKYDRAEKEQWIEEDEGAIVSNCYSTGAVSGDYSGGVVGNANGNVIDCYSTSHVTGQQYTGGIVGIAIFDAGNSIANNVALNPYKIEGQIVSNLQIKGISNCSYGIESIIKSVEASLSSLCELSSNAALCYDEPESERSIDGYTCKKGVGKFNCYNITIADIKSDGTLGGRFTSKNGWTVENGKLPGLLGQTVELPEHLK
jgi:hypothetical protein